MTLTPTGETALAQYRILPPTATFTVSGDELSVFGATDHRRATFERVDKRGSCT